MTITTTGSLTILDETAGLQNFTATQSEPEDSNDTDILLTALPSLFSNRLTALLAGTATSAALSGYTGAAGNTGSNAFTISAAPGASITDVSFVDSSGAALNGLDSGLDTLDGTSIFLYTDTSNNNILLGRAGSATGAIVFAAYIEETGSPVSGGKIWTVEYQPLKHPDTTNPDDALNLANKVFIGTSEDLVFSLANAPSGQNLFLMFTTATPTVVGGRITDPTIIATGKNPADQSAGANITTGDTINTSQAGGPTTFGTNNQMITEQEGIRFTFVTGARQDLTIPNLDQNEADLESNIDFTAVFNAQSASFDVVQLQGGKTAQVKVSAFTTAAEPGVNFINGYAGDTSVAIINVRVINISTGQVIENSNGSVNDPGIAITFTAGVATITGVKAGYKIEYTTTAVHNRVLVENGAALNAKGTNHADFDIGGFKLTHVSTATAEIGSKLVFEDDGPSANGTAVAGTVDEDGLAGGIAGGTGDVAGAATVASGSVTGIFQPGADAPLTYSLSGDTSGLPALTSGGVAVTYSVVGNTLTASAGAVDVFTFSLTAAGAYSFTLLKPLDHAPGNDENDITLNLGSLLRATDADGDKVTAAAEKLVITVDDDTPTATGAAVAGTVDEDGLAGGIAGGTGDVAGAATTASGSVTGIFQSGADAPLSYALSGDTSGLPQTLTSGGVAVTYSIVGNTLTASAGAVAVFTFSLTAAGAYSFTLLKALDHAAGNDENDITLNLGSLLRATDADGDTVTAAPEKLIITVDDDTPTATGAAVAGTVDEDGLVGGIAGGIGDVAGAATVASGSVTGIFQSGADAPLSYSLSSNTSGLPQTLTSGGVGVTYNVVGNTLTASAGAVAVFTFSLTAAGAYSFTLLKALDHAAGNDENDITLNLGSLLQATDADGDTVTAAPEKLVITVDDDTPTLAFGNLMGTGTILPQYGNWSMAAGADGLGAAGLDISLVNGQFTLVRPDNTTTTGTGTLNELSPSPDANGAYRFAGSLIGDFDNNATTANTTIDYTLTAFANGTYALDLVQGFSSTIVLSSADGSLDAGGPDPVRTLLIPKQDPPTIPSPSEEIVFFGVNAGTTAAQVLSAIVQGAPDLTEAQIEAGGFSFLGTADVNVSTSGIGIGNNNLDGNGTAGINSGDESFVINPETLLTAMKVFIDNSLQGYNPATEELYYRIFFEDGTSSAQTKVLAADLASEAGNQKSFLVQWDGAKMIDAVQLTMGLGEIKVPVIQFIKQVENMANDIQLAFNATLTDRDGDTATSTFDANLFANDPNDPLFDYRLAGTIGEQDAFNVNLSAAENLYQVNGFDAGPSLRDKLVLIGDAGAVVQSIDNTGANSIVTIDESGAQNTTITVVGVDLLNTDILFGSA
ncbi:DUF5801 repeats-in-toxin domain-containing protein [Metapseudomonas resinovorans]|nr:hypothetical protein [Pseudomonas resinovorans]